jgi:hypothetical protein
VGLADAGSTNPFSQVPMPHIWKLLGGPLVLNGAGEESASAQVTFRAVDACMGVDGLPQSATGQAALFTGVNAPALVGRHISAFPTAPLRELIAEKSLLKQVADQGGRVLFANAHSELFWEMIRQKRRPMGVSTLTALAAGAPIPTMDDLRAGRAVLWDITHEVARGYLGYELALVAAEEAGARLARLAAEYDLVLFESFLPDLAGHRRGDPEWVLRRLDPFLGSVLTRRSADTTVVVCSDHGNIEDTSTKAHTRNPVPLLVVGPAAHCFREAKAITDVAPAILAALDMTGRGEGAGTEAR